MNTSEDRLRARIEALKARTTERGCTAAEAEAAAAKVAALKLGTSEEWERIDMENLGDLLSVFSADRAGVIITSGSLMVRNAVGRVAVAELFAWAVPGQVFDAPCWIDAEGSDIGFVPTHWKPLTPAEMKAHGVAGVGDD
ncbi:hypothetical protein P7L75_01350 (plasmid) [Tistrella mobilis]|uniref:hypothetical protein n=1 Tax=Tistrella mobilis TaxID=171437 RepID=UPI003558E805